MATTEKDKAAQAKKRAASTKEANQQQTRQVNELDRNRDLRDARAQSQINEPVKVKPDHFGDIDQRLAAVLQDHIKTGARPKE